MHAQASGAARLCPQRDMGLAKRRYCVNDWRMNAENTAARDALIDPAVVAQVIAHVGTPEFGAGLDAAMRQVAAIDLTAVIAYPEGRRPLFLHDGLDNVSDPGAMAAYLDGTYLLDAFYTACKRQTAPGLYRLSDVAPDAFFEGEYYNSPHVHPCISLQSGVLAEEVAFLIRFPNGLYATYSLMRASGSAAFSAAEMAALSAYDPIVRAAVLRNWSVAVQGTQVARPADGHELEAAFRSFAPDALSPREQVIVSLVLRGHSSASVGLNLGIAEGTVKNHRKHIHAKLGISSQAELFGLFLRHLQNA
jgi:DNA-binding CsgD family transcriptional regulator